MKLAYSSIKIFPRRPKIELLGMIAEKLPMHPGPDEPPIGVYIDLGDAEFGRGQIFILVHAAGRRIEFAAGRVDPLDFFEIGTLELPCITIGVPGIRFWISSMTLKRASLVCL